MGSAGDLDKGQQAVATEQRGKRGARCAPVLLAVEQGARDAPGDSPGITFGKIDTEAERELAAAFQITSIPTLVAIRDRTVVFSQPGALPAAALADVIAQVRAIDTEQLRQARGTAA
jgi:thioredoxin-like negative regulator of GroEL